MRTLCKDCKEEYVPTQEEFAELMEEYGLEHWDKLGIHYSPDFKLYRPKGCPKCGNTGYKGRMGIHELLVATDEIKRLIQKRTPIEQLRKQALVDGMFTKLSGTAPRSGEGPSMRSPPSGLGRSSTMNSIPFSAAASRQSRRVLA